MKLLAGLLNLACVSTRDIFWGKHAWRIRCIEAARNAGVKHIVKLSAFGASDHSKAPICLWHYQVEKEMQASGMDWTILRPHHFMQNLLGQAEYIIDEGLVYSASGDGKIPYIDARDIAAVAAVTLTKPGHEGKKYVITGSEALSYRDARFASPVAA